MIEFRDVQFAGYWEFHAYYQDCMAVVSIDPVELTEGRLPPRQRRLVEAWAEIHQPELMRDWECLQSGGIPVPIAPLN